MRFALILIATAVESLWLPHNWVGVSVLAATAVLSLALILKGYV